MSDTSGTNNREATSVAGKGMADIVTQFQADAASNVINNGAGSMPNLLAALGNAQFPDGSSFTRRANYSLNAYIYIANVYADVYPADYARKLEDLVASMTPIERDDPDDLGDDDGEEEDDMFDTPLEGDDEL